MECAQSGQLQLPVDPSMVQSPPHTPRAYYSPVIFTPQAPVVPLQWPDEIMQNRSSDEAKEKTREEHLQRTDKDVFAIMKVLPAGVYHFRFIVDGQWRCAADSPRECDNLGNVFNVLDLQDTIPEVPNNSNWPDSPPSPESSYNSAPFTAQDFSDKVPDLPPLLQQSPLDQSPSSSTRECSSLEKPSAAVLNHLFIQRGRRAHSTVALTSTHRFRAKYVTVVLYKSLHNLKK
nr:SNF1-related protein kinase regulatory subunit beta-2-like [Ipomoea batatas]